jgi:hypothetical protein
MNEEPEFPVYGHQAAIDLMRRLLVKEPERRIGIDEIKAHRLFAEVKLERVYERECRSEAFEAEASAPIGCMLSGCSFGPPDEPELAFKFAWTE